MSEEIVVSRGSESRQQAPAKWVENWLKHIAYGAVYAFLSVLNHGHSYQEIRDGSLSHAMAGDKVVLPDNADADLAIEEARRVAEREESRREVVDDKSKVMLTVSALLLAANAALLPHAPLRWLALIPLCFVFVAVFLLLMYFRTYKLEVVHYKNVNWTDPNKARLAIAQSEFACAESMSPQNDLRIGVHRAARRSLVLALAFMAPVLLTVVSIKPTDPLVNRIQADAKLRALLQGPPGAIGPMGPPGPSCDSAYTP